MRKKEGRQKKSSAPTPAWVRSSKERGSDRTWQRLTRLEEQNMPDIPDKKTAKKSPVKIPTADPVVIPKTTRGGQPDPMDELKVDINKMLVGLEGRLAKRIKDTQEELMEGLTQVVKDVGVLQTDTRALAETCKKHEDQLSQHEQRIIAMEDRDRRANLRIRKYPEQERENLKDLRDTILSWLKTQFPEGAWEEEDLERVHRVGFKGRGVLPRDIIVKFANYYKKEKLMQAIRKQPQPMIQATAIEIFQDLSPQTIQWRKSVKICTAALRKKSITYNWGYPVFLRFAWCGKQERITSCEQGIQLLEKLGIIDPNDPGEVVQEEGAVGGSSQ